MFHQPNVLVGSGVEHVIWPPLFEDRPQGRGVSNVRDVRLHGDVDAVGGQFVVYQKQAVFPMVHEQQALRLEPHQLTANFGSNTASGPGDQDR